MEQRKIVIDTSVLDEADPPKKVWRVANETYWRTWSLGVSFSPEDVHIAIGPFVFGFVKDWK